MTVTFFGNRNAPQDIEARLESVLIDLIENYGADNFYVGNQGNFDFIVHKSLKRLKIIYPHINYAVVLAYLPGVKGEFDYTDYADTVYPDGIEKGPLKFAIDRRNNWMLKRADCVVTYVRNICGGARKFRDLALSKGKKIIDITEV